MKSKIIFAVLGIVILLAIIGAVVKKLFWLIMAIGIIAILAMIAERKLKGSKKT